jgi:hypothetical protein
VENCVEKQEIFNRLCLAFPHIPQKSLSPLPLSPPTAKTAQPVELWKTCANTVWIFPQSGQKELTVPSGSDRPAGWFSTGKEAKFVHNDKLCDPLTPSGRKHPPFPRILHSFSRVLPQATRNFRIKKPLSHMTFLIFHSFHRHYGYYFWYSYLSIVFLLTSCACAHA